MRRQGLSRLLLPVVARQNRDIVEFGQRLGACLVAEGAHRGWGRSDPDETRVDDGLGEVRVFGQETIAGVDRPRAARAGRIQKSGLVQVAVGRE